MEINTGNISTIATWIAITVTAILTYFGYTVDQTQLIATISAIITLIIAIWSSKNPNTMKILGNQPHNNNTNDDGSEPLNQEYTSRDEDGY